MSRVAAITGGAGGIGGAIAAALEESGHTVAIVDLDAEFSADLSSEEDTRACARALLERYGRVDVLVHAAASFERVPLAELDRETLRRVHAVNVEALLWLVQELAPKMTEEGFGRIIGITSDSVQEPSFAEFLPYVSSKSALIGVIRVLAHTLGAGGITANCVLPRPDQSRPHGRRGAAVRLRTRARAPGGSAHAGGRGRRRHRRLPRLRGGVRDHRPGLERQRRGAAALGRRGPGAPRVHQARYAGLPRPADAGAPAATYHRCADAIATRHLIPPPHRA